jgi:hypothetical protein
MTMDGRDDFDERRFLHDLANPLGTVILLAESLLDQTQNRADIDPDNVVQLSQICQALEKLSGLLSERRDLLIKRAHSESKA